MRNIVVLPQPEGPSRHITSPLTDVRFGLVDRDEVTEALRQLVEPDLVHFGVRLSS